MSATTAQDLLGLVLDEGSFRCWDSPPRHRALDRGYARQLEDAATRSGNDEAVRTGEGTIGGRAIAVVCSEFAFLAGSIGAATADRIVAAIERATARRLPLLAMTASGGTRMQEGTPALLRMGDITAAICEHRATGLPYMVHQRSPTTGGVLASWGSLGQLTFAEPGALIGFLGPKVHAALHHGVPLPDGVQTAENLHAHGLVDALLTVPELGPVVGRVLRLLDVPTAVEQAPSGIDTALDDLDSTDGTAWDHVVATRRRDRPGARDLLRLAADDTVALGAEDTGDVVALTRMGRTTCVLVGQDRRAQGHDPIGPRALRAAARGVALATDLRLPLVTIIDTPGAELSAAAESGGLAAHIARCLAAMLCIPTPTVSVLLGEGAGGAALALLPADRVLAARHAWLTPLPPEGAAAIMFGTADRGAEAAQTQRITALDLRSAGAIDRIIAERPDAADEPVEFCRRVVAVVEHELGLLSAVPEHRRLSARRERARGR